MKILIQSFISIILCCSFLLHSKTLTAQKETDVWNIMYGTFLDFNNDSLSVFNIPTNDMWSIGWASAATICDKDGKLLMYTNGEGVYDTTGSLMPNNCTNLGGHFIGPQRLIIPKPGHPSKYYVVVTPNFASTPIGYIKYSEVDMSLYGGLGAVTGTCNIQLGLYGIAPTWKLTACYHANGKDIWLLMHQTYTDAFCTYLVTENGISAYPVVSNIGILHQQLPMYNMCSDFSSQGEMKFSPDGSKLAVAVSGMNMVQLFDFDATSGVISNPISFTDILPPHSVEFSPDGTILYYSTRGPHTYQYYCTPGYHGTSIIQADLLETDSASIVNSVFQIFTYSDSLNPYHYSVNGMQLASNGIVYSTHSTYPNQDTLFCIEYPSLLGASSNYHPCLVLSDFGVNYDFPYWLPNFFRSYLNRNIMEENICYGDTTLLYTLTNLNFDSIRWEFMDSTIGQQIVVHDQDSVWHSFSTPGSYEIELYRYRNGVENKTRKRIYILPNINIALGPDTLLCDGQAIDVELNYPHCEFEWQNDSSFAYLYGDTVALHQPASWWPMLTNFDEYCGNTDTIAISVIADSLDLGSDSAGICISNPLVLDASNSAASSYTWSTGATTSVITADDNGYFWVQVQQGICLFSDTILLSYDEPLPVDLADTVFLCDSLPETISGGDFFADFLWSPTGQSTSDITISAPGNYSVTASNGCGDFTDSTTAMVLSSPTVSLGNDTTICLGDTLYIELNNQPLTTYQWSEGSTGNLIQLQNGGTYTVTASNDCGTSTDDIVLTTHQNLFSFPFDSLTLPYGQTIDIDAGSGYISYQWSTSETTQSITVSIIGLYGVDVQDSIGCWGNDSVEVVREEGIGTISGLANIKVYPNPVKNELVVDFSGTDYKSAPAISLWNSLGQEVSRSTARSGCTGSRTTFDTSALPKGIYLLSIQQGNEKVVVKVVKE